jgi:tetratricopeptide (TPR) repeat protein
MPTKRFLPTFILAFCSVVSLCSVAAERRAPAQSNSASTTLIETASRQYEKGQLDQAAATLERALHIQPNNPATLHYLGVLRLQQGQYQQAENLALRSNMRVAGNAPLRNRNLQLIQAARQAQSSGTRRDAGNLVNAATDRAADAPTASEAGFEQRQMANPRPEAAYAEVEIPRGHMPAPGKCRIWFADRPPAHQPAPGKCKKLRYRVPAGAYLVRG